MRIVGKIKRKKLSNCNEILMLNTSKKKEQTKQNEKKKEASKLTLILFFPLELVFHHFLRNPNLPWHSGEEERTFKNNTTLSRSYEFCLENFLSILHPFGNLHKLQQHKKFLIVSVT